MTPNNPNPSAQPVAVPAPVVHDNKPISVPTKPASTQSDGDRGRQVPEIAKQTPPSKFNDPQAKLASGSCSDSDRPSGSCPAGSSESDETTRTGSCA